jgi:hypothetical protein
MKVRFTGTADGSATYQGKYVVETGTVLENVPEGDANLLLQTGVFEVFETANDKDNSKKFDDTRKTDAKDSSKK